VQLLTAAVKTLASRDRDIRTALSQGASVKPHDLSVAVKRLWTRDQQIRTALNEGLSNQLRAIARDLNSLRATVDMLNMRLDELDRDGS